MSRTCLVIPAATRSAKLQLEPLRRGRQALAKRGWQLAFFKAKAFDVIAVQFDWRGSADDVIATLDRLRDHGRPVVFLDHYDATGTPYPQALAHCDVYLKKQLPEPIGDLAATFSAGSRFGNDVARGLGLEANEERHPDLAAHLGVAAVGWNVGASDFVRKSLFNPLGGVRRTPAWAARPVDVNLIVGLSPAGWDDWYSRHRELALAAAERLPATLTTLVRGTRPGDNRGLPPRQYRRSFAQAKLVVSPFGYGEICYRDFEAIAAGALLVKPRVPPMATAPDVYRDGELYAACAWDFADLADVVAARLADADGSAAMASRARHLLVDYARRHAAAERFADVLDALLRRK